MQSSYGQSAHVETGCRILGSEARLAAKRQTQPRRAFMLLLRWSWMAHDEETNHTLSAMPALCSRRTVREVLTPCCAQQAIEASQLLSGLGGHHCRGHQGPEACKVPLRPLENSRASGPSCLLS
eukprot:1149349-Pelagomonas_calceolata.AAC.3